MKMRYFVKLVFCLLLLNCRILPAVEVSGIYLTRWQAAVAHGLAGANSNLTRQALSSLRETGENLPAAERSEAERFLRQTFCGVARMPAVANHFFAASQDWQRVAFFTELDGLKWTGGSGGLAAVLWADLLENPALYDSSFLRLPGVASFYRKHLISRDQAEALLRRSDLTPLNLLNSFWLVYTLHPRHKKLWHELFESALESAGDPLLLAEAFQAFNQQDRQVPSALRDFCQAKLAEAFFNNVPAHYWDLLEIDALYAVARAGKAPLAQWELKLLEALLPADEPGLEDTLACLRGFVLKHAAFNVTFKAFRPVLNKNPKLFCLLHTAEHDVMEILNRLPRNREASVNLLIDFLQPTEEMLWDSRLAELVPRYYKGARNSVKKQLFESLLKPIVLARLDAAFDLQRLDNPVRQILTSFLLDADGFLTLDHQLVLIEEFLANLDWEAEVKPLSGSMKNYRFTAEALLALNERCLQPDTPRRDGMRYAAVLARWFDWILRGGLLRPETLQFNHPEVEEYLRLVGNVWRATRNRHALRQDDLDLKTLFASVSDEMKEAAEDLRAKGGDYEAGRARRDRLVRSIRLTLTVSSLLQDTSRLPSVLSVLKTSLFPSSDLKSKQMLVRQSDRLSDEVELFLMLDQDLADCLSGLALAPDRTTESVNLLRAFALDYHRQVQLELLSTDGFLSLLHEREPDLLPYGRYLRTGAGSHPCSLRSEDVRESFLLLISRLDKTGYLNAEAGLPALIKVYRDRLGFSFWQNPLLCGLNLNFNLPVLIQVLQDEPLPEIGLESGMGDDGWQNPVFVPVIDALQAGLAAGPELTLISRVLYSASGEKQHVEYHSNSEYIRRLDFLLRAQELLSFPVELQNAAGETTILPPSALARFFARSAVFAAGTAGEATLELPEQASVSRKLNAERRIELCRLAQKYTSALNDAIAAADCALMLPNSRENSLTPADLPVYDSLRLNALEKLRYLLDENAYDEQLTDALIAALRLDASFRGRRPTSISSEWPGKYTSRLSEDSQRRLLLEQLRLLNHSHEQVETLTPCADHSVLNLECRACRDSAAEMLALRAAELRLSLQTVSADESQPVEPQNQWDAIAQLASFQQRLSRVSEEITAITSDTVKSAWYLKSQLSRAIQAIPSAWLNRPHWTACLESGEPLAEAVLQTAYCFSAAYSDLMPIHGNLVLDDLLGNAAGRQANGDALVVFSLLDAEIKSFLLDAAKLEQNTSEWQKKSLSVPVGSLSPLEITAVHSAIQPPVALGVWERGKNVVQGGGTLIQFVVRGKSYRETYFDLNTLLETGGIFSLSPSHLFKEALRSWDLLLAASGSAESDDFIYNAWFGDLRNLTAGSPDLTELYNLDRFICSAIDIIEDSRYQKESAEIRTLASAFQDELKSWLAGSGEAALRRGMSTARTPLVLTLIAERMADRLGLHQLESNENSLPALTADQQKIYADFCRQCLFDSNANQPSFSPSVRQALTQNFFNQLKDPERDKENTPDALSAVRMNFLRLLGSFETSDTAAFSSASDGIAVLYRRSLADTMDSPGFWFAGDFVHSYMQLMSEIYWYGARDGKEGNPAVTISYPWRLDEKERAYIAQPLPENALNAPELHTAAMQANLAWRAAAVESFSDVPFLRRFFGGFKTDLNEQPESEL